MFKERKNFYLTVLSFISFFSTLWVRKADLMESRNFITAREIVKNNEWVVTTLNGNYRFEKPPLPTWLTAITMKLSNNFSDEWILRIPVALASVLLIYFIYKFVGEVSKDKKTAFFSAFIGATTFMLTKVGSENAWDAYPYIFMFGSITFLLKSFNKKSYFKTIIGGILLGASLLSKGPVAIYGMLLPFLISYFIAYGFKNIKKNRFKIMIYFLIGVGLASIWPLAMIIENKDIFLSVMNKEKNTWSSKHTRGILFYFNYFLFMGSWIFFAITTFLKRWSFQNKDENRFFKFGILWTVLTFILLSLIKMKKERYGFPIYVISTLPIGVILNYYMKNDWNLFKKWDRSLFYTQAIFVSIVSAGSIGIIAIKKPDLLYSGLPFLFLLAYILRGYLKDKNSFKKSIVYSSGIILVLVNCNLTWIVEKEIRSDRKNTSIEALEVLQKQNNELNIYSDDFTIDDVWSVGQNVLTLEKKTILPKECYILSKNPKLEIDKKYKIVSKKSYARFSDSDKLIYLYRVSN
ncbi:MAG: ArnT family glycosyltransferase [Cetobacterium sp.]